MKSSTKETLIGLGCVIAVLILFYGFIQFAGAAEDPIRQNCPYNVSGNPNASLTIKYIDSATCVWCWFEEPILKDLVEKKGDKFKLEKYDINYCEEAAKYGIRATPGFVFGFNGQERVHTGFLEKAKLLQVICEATGDCYG